MPPTRDIVFDTTVLSNFATVGRLEILEHRYHGTSWATVEVHSELTLGVHSGYGYLEPLVQALSRPRSGAWIRILEPGCDEELLLRQELSLRLGLGKSSCLAAARCRDLVLATDDKAARQLARQLGARLTGTVGVLVASVRDNSLRLAEANSILADMIRRRYHCPVDSLDDLI